MKLNLLTVIIFLFYVNGVFAQTGCTDPLANNYNPAALTNDGSCTYDATSESYKVKGPMFSFSGESSGLVFTNGVLWTHNDSGNASDIFKVDTTNGGLLQKVSITNFPNNDWEDITADSNYIYVGDFGNNNGTRTDLKVLKIDKAQLTSTVAIITATAQAINFSYSDQTSYVSNGSNNYDCESIISIGNFLYLFTKDRGDFQTRVYKLSKTPGTYTISPYTTYNVNGKITGADYNKQKNEVVLIGYLASNRNSFIYFLNDFTGDMFFSGNKRRIEIGNSINDWQTEGIAYASNNELFLSCETSFTTATLYTTSKTTMVVASINELQKESEIFTLFPNPTSGNFEIKCDEVMKEIEIINLEGEIVFSKKIGEINATIKINELSIINGCYFVRVKSASHNSFQKLILNK